MCWKLCRLLTAVNIMFVGAKKEERNGIANDPTYRIWKGMLYRCRNVEDKDYGGRGISVCAEWTNSFVRFLRDMGERPTGRSIDRIDNNGNYEPGNCRWATPLEQAQNRRRQGRLPKLGRVDGVPLVALRVSVEVRSILEQVAARKNMAVNEWARSAIMEAAERERVNDSVLAVDAGASASHGAEPPAPAYQVVYDEDGRP